MDAWVLMLASSPSVTVAGLFRPLPPAGLALLWAWFSRFVCILAMAWASFKSSSIILPKMSQWTLLLLAGLPFASLILPCACETWPGLQEKRTLRTTRTASSRSEHWRTYWRARRAIRELIHDEKHGERAASFLIFSSFYFSRCSLFLSLLLLTSNCLTKEVNKKRW